MMSNKAKPEAIPVISIDYKWHRIRIHKQTLLLLGDPEYVELLVNPETKILAVRCSTGGSDRVHRVKGINKDGAVLQSAYLFRSLQQVNPELKEGKSYRIYGRMNAKEGIAQFRLAEIEEIKRMETKV
ncbi:MAG: hypothetical protein IJI75_15250 [Solobacterium sp.]|nr:hypothetical protein [Solobacterium sp.]